MKPVDVKWSTYIVSSNKVIQKDPKFKIGDTVRISKYKNIFTKGYVQNWSKEVSVIKKVKNTVPWTYIISDLKSVKIVETYKKNKLKKKKKEFRVENVIKSINYMLNGNARIVLLTVGLIKKIKNSFFWNEIFSRKSESWIRFV